MVDCMGGGACPAPLIDLSLPFIIFVFLVAILLFLLATGKIGKNIEDHPKILFR